MRNDARVFQARHSWRDVERYKAKFDIPLILKGIATAEDAKRAVELSIDCVSVSNHGGRQLDHVLGSLDVLPEIVEAVGDRARIIVDGGISCATDVVKAMILGADAVAVSRPYVYGLAAAGRSRHRAADRDPPACDHNLSRLARGHRLCLDKSYIAPARPVTTSHVHSAFPLLGLPRETY